MMASNKRNDYRIMWGPSASLVGFYLGVVATRVQKETENLGGPTGV